MRFLLTLLACSVPFTAFAQEGEDPAPAPEIVITGIGLPDTPGAVAYATRIIEAEQIATVPSGRIEDVLGAVAGFQQFRRSDSRSANPSAQGVTLRALGGNATSRALVTLDGVPVADPFFGYIPLSALDPARLGRIVVTRGGGSGPFGAGALAGTIALESANPAAREPVLASLLANDRGATEASASIAAPVGTGTVVASGRWDRGRGFFTTPVTQRVPASTGASFDSWSADLRAEVPVNDALELQARLGLFDDQRTLRFDGADSRSRGQDASLRFVGSGRWQFDALAYVQARNFSNVVISSTRFVKVLDQRNTPSTGLGGKLELRPPVGTDHTLRIGVDYRRADGELQEDAFSAFTGRVQERRRGGGRTSDVGLFVEDDWTRGALVLTGGIRADRTVIENGFFTTRDNDGVVVNDLRVADRADWTLTWRGGAAFAVSNTLRLRAAAYRGLRLPTLNELYRPFVVFPIVTQANAALENEVLEGFEAGIDVTPAPGVTFTLTAFDNRVNNAIANVTLTPTLRERRNLPAIDARGLEGGLSVSRGIVSFDATATYTEAVVDGRGASAAIDGFRPAQSPRLAAAATASVRPAGGWVLSATLRHVGTQFEDDSESERLPPATTLGAHAQMPLASGVSLVLRGENLFDETVITRNSGGSVDLGTPRTLWAGVRLNY